MDARLHRLPHMKRTAFKWDTDEELAQMVLANTKWSHCRLTPSLEQELCIHDYSYLHSMLSRSPPPVQKRLGLIFLSRILPSFLRKDTLRACGSCFEPPEACDQPVLLRRGYSVHSIIASASGVAISGIEIIIDVIRALTGSLGSDGRSPTHHQRHISILQHAYCCINAFPKGAKCAHIHAA